MDLKKEYRITARRPIAGRMRKIDDIVELTQREYEAEKGWGGLELVTPAPAPKKPAAKPAGKPAED